jgi:hypothetical protein
MAYTRGPTVVLRATVVLAAGLALALVMPGLAIEEGESYQGLQWPCRASKASIAE